MIQRYTRVLAAFGALALLTTSLSMAQSSVSGTVTDFETGDPLPGANVLIQGSTQGTATDVNGRYTLDGVANGSYNLVATFVGYESTVKVLIVRG
ncbi:MAG: hypothetical protein ACI9W4_003064, partial [Rhodothermales bacterium]